MDPSNPNSATDTPATSPNSGMPQPLSTSGPVGMGSGDTADPASSSIPVGEGLPSQMPGNPQVTTASGGGKKWMVIIIIILVLAILAVGGYFFYTSYNKGSSQAPVTDTQSTQQTQDLTNLKNEADNIQITDPAGDLNEVDSQINLLEATPASSAAKTAK
ncbi:MAG TPA: hypothetical protein VJG66_01755 [Patescibacteria group bacterium]|nr:hypothetical protein [Patescibacteria group bacterium]